jgi:hypothetical protein
VWGPCVVLGLIIVALTRARVFVININWLRFCDSYVVCYVDISILGIIAYFYFVLFNCFLLSLFCCLFFLLFQVQSRSPILVFFCFVLLLLCCLSSSLFLLVFCLLFSFDFVSPLLLLSAQVIVPRSSSCCCD